MDAYNLMSEDQGSWFYMFIDLNNDVFLENTWDIELLMRSIFQRRCT